MLKKIISKKGIVITLIVVCCLMAFAIFMLLSNKISYTVEKIDGTYNVSVNNRWGKRIYENAYGVGPIIMQVDKDTLLIRTGRGDSWITKFVNGKTNRVSDNFENISAYNGQLVVYGIYEDEQLKIVIRDIYDKDKIYKEVIDTFPNVAVGSYIIKDAQIIDEHSVDLTYYVGDEWEEKEEVVLFECLMLLIIHLFLWHPLKNH